MVAALRKSTLLLALCGAWRCVALQATDPKVSMISIGNNNLRTQQLPISLCSSWPVWMIPNSGSVEVVRVPDASDAETVDDASPLGWVNPHTFEQLWLPEDLPPPSARAAVGFVIKDGAPRYLFPCLETAVVTADGGCYYNRGLNSLPLASTWLPWGEIGFRDLRLSCFSQALPVPEEAEEVEEAEEAEEEAEEAEGAIKAAVDGPTVYEVVEPDLWAEELALTSVIGVVESMLEVIADAPADLGEGFQYVVVPIAGASISPELLRPGRRVRLFLSDVDGTPTELTERDGWAWSRGECDLSVFAVSPGGESDFLPDVYKPLYLGTKGA